MQAALYVRVSTSNQAHTQTIQQQIQRLMNHIEKKGWVLRPEHVFSDDGFSGYKLARPGLDHLRSCVAMAEFDVLVLTEPDRLARNYVHQVYLLEEFKECGCQIEFLERPMSDDPHDQLLLQIRGAVAEYERTLNSERMRSISFGFIIAEAHARFLEVCQPRLFQVQFQVVFP